MSRTMFYLLCFMTAWLVRSPAIAQIEIGNTPVDTTTILSGLDTPWEILWGPDNYIWFTEREGRVSRMNPETGERAVILTLNDVYESGESGLLGMVLHPDFSSHPEVFLVYNYFKDADIRERLVKFTYQDGKLVLPETLLEGIWGSTNHDGSRLVIDESLKLFMTMGDGAVSSNAQDTLHLSGKVLRLNLDGSVPGDNPFPGSYVWSIGHRNPQGLVIAPSGILYSSEHGPDNDDELTIIEKGRNYGWKPVQGFCDLPSETSFCEEMNVAEPLTVWTPTLAVAGIDYYNHTSIPEWNHKILMTTLKASKLVALELSGDGRSVTGETDYFSNWFGRLRDLCIAPDGRVFLAVSNRDGRGTPSLADDRIVEIASRLDTNYCYYYLEASICPGETYQFGERTLTARGTYIDTVSNPASCDSVYILTLNIYKTSATGLPEAVTVAENETYTLSANSGFVSYSWNGNPPSMDNIYEVSGLSQGEHLVVLTVYDNNGCGVVDTVRIHVTEPLGNRRSDQPELRINPGPVVRIYPNPASRREIRVEYSVPGIADLVVYNQTGTEVFRATVPQGENSAHVRLPEAAGLYLVKLYSGSEYAVAKVVKY